MRNKKALIVSPYLDHLGGGERYMLSVASVLENLGFDVFFAWDNLTEIESLATMLGIKLSLPKLDISVKNLYFSKNPFLMYHATRQYGVVVYLSDGSLPMLGGQKNIVHMQVPFHGVGGRSWKNQLKKHFLDYVIVNSHFTKKIVDQEYGIRSHVIYPPVTRITVKRKKTKTILSVGRFEPSINAKKQDVLIKAFRELSPKLPGYKLVLAGASSSDRWVAHLEKLAHGLPIKFKLNLSYAKLQELYAESLIYWHAAGFGIDEAKNPELTEHFGISTVEAISAGCIPLVVPYGGQREIVTIPALHWTEIPELVEKTLALAASPSLPDLDISAYSADNFTIAINRLL